jgi:chitin disaccharide deacetylase
MAKFDLGRRRVLQAMTAGAVGGFTATSAAACTQAPGASTTAGQQRSSRKMAVRADDIGHSVVCNIGTFEAIQNGVVTSADVMLESPGTEDALERLKAFPWISVGWHMHMWGAPTLEPGRVPSLVEKGGQFDGRFRTDLSQAADVSFDEAVAELRSQIDRCIRILGKAPDTAGVSEGDTPWRRAVKQVVEEFGIVYNFAAEEATNPTYQQKIVDAQQAGEEWAKYYPSEPRPAKQADPKWADRKIINPYGTTAYIDLLTDSISEVEAKYDPVRFYTEDWSGILNYPEDVITFQPWHPGYVDYYVYRLGERVARPRAQQFVVGRTQDVSALCDVRLRNWIKDNRIELVNFRDALYGTREYQDHLTAIGSDLAISG